VTALKTPVSIFALTTALFAAGCRPVDFNAGRPPGEEGTPPEVDAGTTPNGSHLELQGSRSTVSGDTLNAELRVAGAVPLTSTTGFGYAVRSAGNNNVLVAAMHAALTGSPTDTNAALHLHNWDFKAVTAACTGYEAEVDRAATNPVPSGVIKVDGATVSIEGARMSQLGGATVTELAVLELRVPASSPSALCVRTLSSVKPGGYLNIASSTPTVSASKLTVSIVTNATIPLDGRGNGFGYAVVTDANSNASLDGPDLDNVVVLVTHTPHFDDSSHEDLVSGFHAHVLDLMAPTTECAGYNLEVNHPASVVNTGFDADYDFTIQGNTAVLRDIPTAHLHGDTRPVLAVVAFTVAPLVQQGKLTNLCVDVIGL
jgi:hypothetical protein